MAGSTIIPSPEEIAAQLRRSPDRSKPILDLATLEKFYQNWYYPKSLDFWEGYLYADLLEQLGWAHLRHEEYKQALRVWRECPWNSVTQGERQALAHIIQSAYENKTLVLGPAVVDLMSHSRVQLGQVLASLDDPAATLYHAASGRGYVMETRVVQADGLYSLRFELDITTLFYVSFVPVEVHGKLLLARTAYLMGEAQESARWLLRAAYLAHRQGLSHEAVSFLEKALQLEPENETVTRSLMTLREKGIGPTLFSRVLVERSLFQPDPLKRCEVRPETGPVSEPMWFDHDWRGKLAAYPLKGQVEGKIVSLGSMPTERARELAVDAHDRAEAWTLLLPASWTLPPLIDNASLTRDLSLARGVSLEKLRLWKADHRKALAEMLEAWPSFDGRAPEPEVLEFALPKEAQVCVFGCTEQWQIPLLLQVELGELGSRAVLAAWLRRLAREWSARPLMIAEDVIWFQLDELPEEERRELFLADLLCFSSDVAECFEPAMIRPYSDEGPYYFPVPLQLSLL